MRFYIIEYRVNGWGGEKDFMTDDSFFRSLDEAEYYLLREGYKHYEDDQYIIGDDVDKVVAKIKMLAPYVEL
ncbi:hypothetical protein [Staphylococcus pseudintermedius]|uniref:hypothetical protein n=1 Tax=Staphylococcus pseudintermedius TaxID=283734 RepID=UPI001BDE93E5|nr:hypothetical protein [Staphylococcus pseudintermedius]